MYNQSQKSEKIFLVDPPPHVLLKTGRSVLFKNLFFFFPPNTSTLSSSPYTPHQKKKKNISGVENVYKKILILKGTQKDRGG
jgi:hypothetical protein